MVCERVLLRQWPVEKVTWSEQFVKEKNRRGQRALSVFEQNAPVGISNRRQAQKVETVSCSIIIKGRSEGLNLSTKLKGNLGMQSVWQIHNRELFTCSMRRSRI